MKALELRIGNWLTGGAETAIKGDFQVEGWHINAMVAFEKTAKRFVDWQPIPLTEEWLKKFGFTKQGELNYTRYWHKNPDALFSFGNYARSNDDPESKPTLKARCKDGQTNQVSIASLKYVHQLQNLYFALTGEELKCA